MSFDSPIANSISTRAKPTTEARSITRIVEQCRDDKAELYARVVDCLRDEFSDIQQQIASDLRPAVLDHLGLKEAIEWETTKFEARTGIRCRLTWELKHEPGDRSKQLALFRILQEALTNVVRHAHAANPAS